MYLLFYFFAQIVSALATWSTFSWLLSYVPLTYPNHVRCFFLFFLSTCLLSDTIRWLSSILPAYVLESAISLRSLDSFYWRIVLETKSWRLCVFIATNVSLFLCSLNWKNEGICVCILIWIYTHTYNYFYM